MGHRILVVEDSAPIRLLIQLCLRSGVVEVITREDGPSGLEAVATESPDLVVLDIGLPGMDGWHVLEAMRSQIATRDVPVLVLTAHAAEAMRDRADLAGADAFMTKPFQPSDLREKVLALLWPQEARPVAGEAGAA